MSRPKTPALDRLLARVVETDAGCWQFTGRLNIWGYGSVKPDSAGSRFVHRIAFEWFIAEIPAGLVIDHLCRNRACCNPWHLEVVDHRTNLLRGQGVGAVNAAKTECANGHPYDGENTKHIGGKRQCRTCLRVNSRNYRQRKASV